MSVRSAVTENVCYQNIKWFVLYTYVKCDSWPMTPTCHSNTLQGSMWHAPGCARSTKSPSWPAQPIMSLHLADQAVLTAHSSAQVSQSLWQSPTSAAGKPHQSMCFTPQYNWATVTSHLLSLTCFCVQNFKLTGIFIVPLQTRRPAQQRHSWGPNQ